MLTRRMNKSADAIFKIGLFIKGFDSILEAIGGVVLFFPTKLSLYLAVLAQHELFKHHDVLAGRLDRLADTVEMKVTLAGALYLFIHGSAKSVLIWGVFKEKAWGYVGLIVVMSIFAIIEFGRSIQAHEPIVGLLALFDLGLVWLMRKEYYARFHKKAPL